MTTLVPSHVFGLYGTVPHNLKHIDDQHIIYPAGSSLIVNNIEQKTQRIIILTEGGIVTALTVSSRLIAVAERGDKHGAVTIFDVHTLKRKKVIREEESKLTKGTISLSLSGNSKYLATQSGEPSWHLQLWNWEKLKVNASVQFNYAPNITVSQISFNTFEKCDTATLCVSGNNLFRIFRFSDGALKPLTFQKADHRNNISHTWLNTDCIAVTTGDGKIVQYKNTEYHSEMSANLSANEPNNPSHYLTTIQTSPNGFVTGSNYGYVQIWDRKQDKYMCTHQAQVDSAAIHGIAVSNNDDTITCTTCHNQLISITAIQSDDLKIAKLSHAHHANITGLDTCIRKPIVVTCGTDMAIRVWNFLDNCMETAKFFDTEPLSIALHPNGLFILAGFKDGIKLLMILMDDILPYWDYPVRNCIECSFSNGGQFFAIAHGPLVTVRNTWSCDIIFKNKGHTGNVQSIQWSPNDARMVTVCSKGMALEWDTYTHSQIAEYSDPSHFVTGTFTQRVGSLLLGTSDGRIREYQETQFVREFHLNVPMKQIRMGQNGQCVLASTHTGQLISIQYPFVSNENKTYTLQMHHTPITRLCLSHNGQYVFSTSTDGCLCVSKALELSPTITQGKQPSLRPVTSMAKSDVHSLIIGDKSYSDEVLALRPNIQTQLQIINQLKKQVDDLDAHNERVSSERDETYTLRIADMVQQFEKDRTALLSENQSIQLAIDTLTSVNTQTLTDLKAQHLDKQSQSESNTVARLNTEHEKARLLNKSIEYKNNTWSQKIKAICDATDSERKLLQQCHANNVLNMDSEKQKIEQSSLKRQTKYETSLKELQTSTDQEILQVQYHYEQKLKEERTSLSCIQLENQLLHKTQDTLLKKIDLNQSEISKMVTDEKKLMGIIKSTEKELAGYRRELSERNDTIADKENRILELKKKNKELEKFKFVLDYKIVELHKQINPRQQQIAHLQKQRDQIAQEIKGYVQTKNKLGVKRQDILEKLGGQDRELELHKSQTKLLAKQINSIGQSVSALAPTATDTQTKRVLKSLYQQYCLQAPAQNNAENQTSIPENPELRLRDVQEQTCLTYERKLNKQISSRIRVTKKMVDENVMLTQELNRLRMQK